MMDDSLKNVMKKKMAGAFGGLTIKIELDNDDEKEKKDNAKEDLAPPMKSKDDEVKGKMMMQSEGPANEMNDLEVEDEDEALADNLMSEREQDNYLSMALKDEKPKGLRGKMEQQMVAKKVAKKLSSDKA